MNPSNLDITINIDGRNIRKIFKAIPGRKPWINDFMNFLHEKWDTVSTVKIYVQVYSKKDIANEDIYEENTHTSTMVFRKGAALSIPSMFARD